MKQLILLLTFVCIGSSFAQQPIHFLITADESVQITEPICKEQVKEAQQKLDEWIKENLSKRSKKEQSKLNIETQAYLNNIKKLAENTESVMPCYAMGDFIYDTYEEEYPIYLSLVTPTLKGLGKVNFEFYVSNIRISSSETSMDVQIKNPNSIQSLVLEQHFSAPTGRFLYAQEGNGGSLSWFAFWEQFYKDVAFSTWAESAIQKLDPTCLSSNLISQRRDEALSKMEFLNETYTFAKIAQAKKILKNLPKHIPFDHVGAILISKNEEKICLLSIKKDEVSIYSEDDLSTYTEYESEQMNFERVGNDWNMYSYFRHGFMDSLDAVKSFYNEALAYGSSIQYDEEKWILNNFGGDIAKDEYTYEEGDPESKILIDTYITPKLNELTSQGDYTYNAYYQRTSSDGGYWAGNEITYSDVLISNPNKTAFIYPVLLHRNTNETDEVSYPYHNEEDFKFFVLKKNSDNSYTVYDWYYFKPLEYATFYSLLNCAESHLGNVSNYTSGDAMIDSEAFWNDYVFKTSERGYEYLSPLLSANESISISKTEFDAQVSDCIDLITGYDLVDLYDHQLKQIIRCMNTIQKGNMSGANQLKLMTLSQELHFQNRLNKVRTVKENYYPQLDLEFGKDVSENSYYRIR
jgi:hypothetical protein